MSSSPGISADVINAYNGADVFFMPSYAETFGLVILEALACGVPVVARDIPEFHEIFGNNILYFSDRAGAGELDQGREGVKNGCCRSTGIYPDVRYQECRKATYRSL